MHPYYAEKRPKLRKDMEKYLSGIATELTKETGVEFPRLLEEIWAYYESRILEKLPYVGGDQASGTRNLTGAFVFVAAGEVCRGYGMSLDTWGYLSTLAYDRFFHQIPTCILKLAGKLLHRPGLVIRMLKKKDRKNAENARKNPGSFETETQLPREDYPIIYYTTVCPLAEFARENGYQEYMPYICNLDYVMFEAMEVPFYREHTRAAGEAFCDFKLKKDAPVVPAWPCHGADPEDPLK